LIRFRVGGLATLERVLMVLGPDAELLAPEDFKAVAPRAARRMLSAYR
jgi:predicted DNA-binding transcriptional regulator YafY